MREPMIQRATEYATKGRTIEGIAYHFDKPSRVVDPGKPSYLEAFARTSANKSIAERETFPLAYFHGLQANTPGGRSRWSGEVFGPVRFHAGGDGLEFEATLSRTMGADEMLELLRDGAIGDVSISAYPVKTMKRADIVWRDEIKLIELSLAPVGTGQHEGAKVLAMRAGEGSPLLQSSKQRLRALLL